MLCKLTQATPPTVLASALKEGDLTEISHGTYAEPRHVGAVGVLTKRGCFQVIGEGYSYGILDKLHVRPITTEATLRFE